MVWLLSAFPVCYYSMWLETRLHNHRDRSLWAVLVLHFISVSHGGPATATQRRAHCPRLQKKCDVEVTCVSGMLLPLCMESGSLVPWASLSLGARRWSDRRGALELHVGCPCSAQRRACFRLPVLTGITVPWLALAVPPLRISLVPLVAATGGSKPTPTLRSAVCT